MSSLDEYVCAYDNSGEMEFSVVYKTLEFCYFKTYHHSPRRDMINHDAVRYFNYGIVPDYAKGEL